MISSSRLSSEYFSQNTVELARDLLGKRLVRLEGDRRLAGIIVETEAYRGQADLGCHAKAGLTPRTRVMYGPPGHAYVYFTYGKHWMLNFVSEPAGVPAAVLIRAIWPTEGIPFIAARRPGHPRKTWTDGPAKLCQALGIDQALNGANLCSPDAVLFVEAGVLIPDSSVTISPRVGLNSVPEPWKSIPWRFRVQQDALQLHLRGLCRLFGGSLDRRNNDQAFTR
jgi:DNA-3-methyladenine glycosylase